jgi:hypothetical protein
MNGKQAKKLRRAARRVSAVTGTPTVNYNVVADDRGRRRLELAPSMRDAYQRLKHREKQ